MIVLVLDWMGPRHKHNYERSNSSNTSANGLHPSLTRIGPEHPNTPTHNRWYQLELDRVVTSQIPKGDMKQVAWSNWLACRYTASSYEWQLVRPRNSTTSSDVTEKALILAALDTFSHQLARLSRILTRSYWGMLVTNAGSPGSCSYSLD